MIRRSRHDLLDLHFLIFSIRLRPAPHYASAEALAEDCGVPLRLVQGIEASGLLRSEPSGPGRGYDADDARVVAVAAEILDLGGSFDVVRAYGAHVRERCDRCSADVCPTRCDAIETLRALLAGMAARAEREARPHARLARIRRAIASIDALADLI